MALSGTFKSSEDNGANQNLDSSRPRWCSFIYVNWTATQNIANNTSTITWKCYGGSNYSNTTSYVSCGPVVVKINGVTVLNKTARFSLSKDELIGSGSLTVSHATDGTKSCAVSISAAIYSFASNCTYSGTITLNTIPRATTPTLSSSSVYMGSNVTINTPRASSNFTHDLAYSFAGGSYVSIATGVGTSYNWAVPDLASKTPSATSGTLTIRCITKNSSTTIGTKTVTMTAKVPTSVVPTISAVALAEATSGLAAQFGAYVKGKSKVKATITAAGAKGSTIKSYSTSFQGATYTGASWTSAVLTSSGSLSMTTTVTDTRGRTAKKTTTLTVVDYYPPAITKLRAYRVDDMATPDQEGTWLAVDLAYAVAPVGNENTASLVLEAKKTTDTTWTTVTTTGERNVDAVWQFDNIGGDPFSIDYQYDVRLTLTDWFGAKVTYTAVLPSGAVILDISADGRGISFGTTSDRPGVLFGWPAKGQVFGLGEATAQIPERADLNEYHEPGIYSTVRDTVAATLINCPSANAGTLRVYNALGSAVNSGPWVYMIQEYRSHMVSEPTFRRSLRTNGEGVWIADAWLEG